jgi:hypothetical protein
MVTVTMSVWVVCMVLILLGTVMGSFVTARNHHVSR